MIKYYRKRYSLFFLNSIRISSMILVMQLASVCLLAVTASKAQSITINVKQAPIKTVFSSLESQAQVTFVFNASTIKNIPPVTVHAKDERIESVLNTISKQTGLQFKQNGNFVAVSKGTAKRDTKSVPVPASPKQQRSIEGTVTDVQGNPLHGVTVVEKGTSNRTVTNAEGRYTIRVADKSALIFSSVGFMDQEFVSAGTERINITLIEDIQQLEETVVVGYGVQQKANLTGAVSQINADDIALRPSADITSALQGLLPGLNIQVNSGDQTATPDINIRGFNSINGGGPLVLIDGIEGDISRLNPLDVENVTVLKDASSAAIYGARGAFGVVLITTKTGKAGAWDINYTNNFNYTTPTTRTDFISDPYEYAKVVDAALFGYNGSNYTGYNDMDWETIKLVARGEIEPFHEQQPNGTYKFFYNTNWHDLLFRKWQPSQIHNVSVSGGDEKLKGYLSGRLFERSTIQNIVDSKVDRANIKTNVSYQLTDWLELSHNLLFANTQDGDYLGARNGYGTSPWAARTLWWSMPFQPSEIDGASFDHNGGGVVAALREGNNWRIFKTEEITNTFRARLTPLKGLDINFDYNNRITHTARTIRYNEFELLSGNRIIQETVGLNRLAEYRWRDYYNAINIYGTYSFDLNNLHNFKLMTGYNQEDFDRDRVVAQQSNLLIRELANLSTGTEMFNIDGSALVWAIQGYFGRFNYDYDGKYLMEINARYDGSSRFPDDTRWGFFPSISAGWQMNREKFWKPIEPVIRHFKLRASYGSLGNQSIGVNTFRQLMGLGQSSWLADGHRLNYASAPGPLPRVVSWETTSSVNVGIDLGVLQNKLMVSFDWFEKKTDGMYLPGAPLPAVFGAAEPRENLGGLRNRGGELSINYQGSFLVKNSPLSIRAAVNVSDFQGIITKFENPNGLMSTYWEGQRLGEIWGYRVDGQFQSDEEALAYQSSFTENNALTTVYGYELNTVQNNDWNRLKAGDLKYVDTNGDGRIDRGSYTLDDHGDLQPIGNAMPRFPFGINVSANWKGFDLSVAGAGVAKQDWQPFGEIFWGTYERPYVSFIRKDLVANAWTPENPENTYPQIERGYAALGEGRSMSTVNDYYLTNVGFFRVKNLTVGYTLPQELTARVNIKQLRIYFSGENILTWRFGNLSKYIDPEQAGSAINYNHPDNAVDRSDLRDYPMGKTFSMGINLSL